MARDSNWPFWSSCRIIGISTVLVIPIRQRINTAVQVDIALSTEHGKMASALCLCLTYSDIFLPISVLFILGVSFGAGEGEERVYNFTYGNYNRS